MKQLPKLTLPPFLKELPGRAYLVGGSVRDLMLGRQPADYDIAVDLDARGVADRIATRLGARVILLGHGPNAIHRVVTRTVCVDTAVIKGADIYSDLGARDFTINAMACTLEYGDIIDPFDGGSDLGNRIVRMVTHNAFDDDPLRLIRAYRMAAELDFAIHAKTRSAITERCQRIQEPAGERIWNELSRIMATPASHAHITAMADTGMLEALFPELITLRTCRQNQFHTPQCLGPHPLGLRCSGSCDVQSRHVVAEFSRGIRAEPGPYAPRTFKIGHPAPRHRQARCSANRPRRYHPLPRPPGSLRPVGRRDLPTPAPLPKADRWSCRHRSPP